MVHRGITCSHPIETLDTFLNFQHALTDIWEVGGLMFYKYEFDFLMCG